MGWVTDWIRAHRRGAAVAIVAGVLLGSLGAWVSSVMAGLGSIRSEQFAPDEARDALASVPTQVTTIPVTPDETVVAPDPEIVDRLDPGIIAAQQRYLAAQESPAVSPLLPDEMFTSVLLIGADASGALADSIILILLPSDGSVPLLASIPRDLYVENPCKRFDTKINANLGGCKGVASGPEQLSIAVEKFTGVRVDHFARINFGGFANVVDWMGGVTICVKAPTRDVHSGLDIPAGCTQADGATALAWARSRHTEQLVGGTWTPIAASDFTRQRHQQDMLFQLGKKLASYSSVASLGTALQNLSSAVRIDDGWSIVDIASLAYRYRSLDPDQIIRLSIPTADYRTRYGEQVLLPTAKFNTVLADAYPPAAVG